MQGSNDVQRRPTKPHLSDAAITAAPSTADGAASPDRTDDELLLLPEVCKITRRTEATERWLRHMGRTDYLFKRGRRLAAWKSEVLADLEAKREADRGRQ